MSKKKVSDFVLSARHIFGENPNPESAKIIVNTDDHKPALLIKGNIGKVGLAIGTGRHTEGRRKISPMG
jgi:hypothetical protein